jgi:membrane associated rhomboid family serine protease
VLPIQDVIPSRRRPAVTLSLIATSALLLTAGVLTGPPGMHYLLRHLAVMPSTATLLTSLTALVLQIDVIGGLINLLMFWIFGDNLEDRLGRARFLLLCAGGGLTAVWAGIGMDRDATFVLPAASGVVAAVIGGYTALLPRSRVMVLVPLWREIDLVDVPAPIIALGWFVVHALRHAQPGDVGAVLTAALVIPGVGFAAGACMALGLRRREPKPARSAA